MIIGWFTFPLTVHLYNERDSHSLGYYDKHMGFATSRFLSREHSFEARLRPDWSNTIRTEDYLYRQGVRMWLFFRLTAISAKLRPVDVFLVPWVPWVPWGPGSSHWENMGILSMDWPGKKSPRPAMLPSVGLQSELPWMTVPWTCHGPAMDLPWTCHGTVGLLLVLVDAYLGLFFASQKPMVRLRSCRLKSFPPKRTNWLVLSRESVLSREWRNEWENDLKISINGFVWKCWVNLPNEIAIFHRDNDQQNHWVQWVHYFQTHPNTYQTITPFPWIWGYSRWTAHGSGSFLEALTRRHRRSWLVLGLKMGDSQDMENACANHP